MLKGESRSKTRLYQTLCYQNTSVVSLAAFTLLQRVPHPSPLQSTDPVDGPVHNYAEVSGLAGHQLPACDC